MSFESGISASLIDVAHRIYDRKYVVATDGNLSVRLEADKYLVTPPNQCKGRIEISDLVVCNRDGSVEDAGAVSSEIQMHLAVYQSRNDVNAIIHAHPPYAVALSMLGIAPKPDTLPELRIIFNEIPITDFALPGSKELAEITAGFIVNHDAIILDRHGSLTVGTDLLDAYYKLERLEYICKVYYLASLVGEPRSLPPTEISQLPERSE